MSDDSVESVKSVYNAFAAGDMPTLMELLADIEWHEAEGLKYGGVHRGADAVAQNVLGPLAQDVPDFAVTPEEFIASGETVAVVTRYTGTGTETGKELDLAVTHVWDVSDGELTRFRQFIDTARFNEVVPNG